MRNNRQREIDKLKADNEIHEAQLASLEASYAITEDYIEKNLRKIRKLQTTTWKQEYR